MLLAATTVVVSSAEASAQTQHDETLSFSGCSVIQDYYYWYGNEPHQFNVTFVAENLDTYWANNPKPPICVTEPLWRTYRYVHADPEVGNSTSAGWTTYSATAYQQRAINYVLCGFNQGTAISLCFPDVTIYAWEWQWPADPWYEYQGNVTIDL